MQIPRVQASVKLAELEMKKVLRNLDRANATLGGHLSNEALDSKRNVLKSLHYLKLAKRTVSRRYQVLNVLKGTELRTRRCAIPMPMISVPADEPDLELPAESDVDDDDDDAACGAGSDADSQKTLNMAKWRAPATTPTSTSTTRGSSSSASAVGVSPLSSETVSPAPQPVARTRLALCFRLRELRDSGNDCE